MRLSLIIVLLLSSFFAFAREMEPGSEYYNLSVQLVRAINNLEFSNCPEWTNSIDQQEFLCADFVGDARSFPNIWDASLAQIINNYYLEDALEWNIGALGINKMYSINDSIMSVTIEPQTGISQLVIYVARPLPYDDFSAATNTSSYNNTITSTIPTPSSNPTASYSEVATSNVQNNFYGYPTYAAYVEAYRLKVTNPATTSTPIAPQQQTTATYSNSLPAYCITYPSRPECSGVSNQPVQQAVTPYPTTTTQPVQQTTPVTQSYNGYPSYQAYLEAFHQRYAQDTQAAQSSSISQPQAYSQQTQQSFAGFPSYEAYLQDYNQRYGQAGGFATNTAPNITATVVSPTPVTTVPVTPTTESTNSSQFQVSANSIGAGSTNTTEVTSSTTESSSSSTGSSSNSSEILSLAADETSTSGVLGKISTRGFRNVPWGSTPNRTKDIETWELVDEGLAKDEAYYLAYDGEILGAKVLAVYYFSPKTKILGRGAYIFMGTDEVNSQQVTRHTSLHNMLGKDYGTPSRNEKLWLNEDAKGLRDIDALETGDLLYVTQWDDEQIDVELSLFASSDELMNRVLYSSKLFSVVIDEELN